MYWVRELADISSINDNMDALDNAETKRQKKYLSDRRQVILGPHPKKVERSRDWAHYLPKITTT